MEHEVTVTAPDGFRLRLACDERLAGGSDICIAVLTLAAGSSSDPKGKKGLAHVVEHLVRRPNKVLEAEFRKARLGDFRSRFSFGVAVTDLDHVHFRFTFVKSQFHNFLKAARVMLETVPLTEASLETAKAEVLNEILMKHGHCAGFATAFDSLYELAYKRHPYRWYTLGRSADIENFTVGDCREFFRQRYQPSNAILTCLIPCKSRRSLESEAQKGLRLAEKIQWPRPRASSDRELPRPAEKAQSAPRTKTIFVKEQSSPSILFGIKCPPRNFELAPLLDKFLCGKTSRLRAGFLAGRLYPPRSFFPLTCDPGLYEILTRQNSKFRLNRFDPHWGENAIHTLYREFERINAGRFPEAEFREAKRESLAQVSAVTGAASWESKFDVLVRNNKLALMGQTATGWRRTRERLRSATSEEFHDLAKSILDPDQLNAVIVWNLKPI